MAYFEICPQCRSDDISGNRRQGYARCESCGFESAAGDALPTADQIYHDGPSSLLLTLQKLPSVIALPLRDYLEEREPVLKLWHACDVTELMLRLLVMIGLTDIKRKGELPESLLNELRSRIEEPTLGKWKGMALAIARNIPLTDTIVPELPAFVNEVIVPFLDGPKVGDQGVEASFSALRNHLAHGGGITKAVGARLLALWEAPFAEVVDQVAWLAEVDLLVKNREGGFGVLRGPTTQPTPYTGTDLDLLSAIFTNKDEVAVARRGRLLPLWPLKLFGLPRSSDPDAPIAREATPQLYVRRGEVRLQFTPVGSTEVCQSESDETALDAFRTLFRLDEAEAAIRDKGFQVRGFEADIRKDADSLVGRVSELETLHRSLLGLTEGVLWIWGTAGSGKSFLMARLAAELLDALSAEVLVLPYRFKVGDDRCSRASFLQFALERLQAWPGMSAPEGDPPDSERERKPVDRLRDVLRRLKNNPHDQRVVFLLDGLDEIAERDATFISEVVLSLKESGVVWLCSGRPERGLPEAFSTDYCQHPFPNGLPPMTETDIRAMLMDKIGPLRKRLLQNDREDEGVVVNPFVERVAEFARGLPLYVKYVVGDVLNNRFRALDAGERLPPSLEAYHEELLRRCAVGTLHQVVTPIAVTLAVAAEPLSAETLTVLMQRRTFAPEGERGLQLVQQGLSAIASMLRRAVNPDGIEGFTLFHSSLRQHINESETTRDAVDLARLTICEAALHPGDDAVSSYLYRHGITHLLETGRTEDAAALLLNFEWLDAKLRVCGPHNLVTEFNRVLNSTEVWFAQIEALSVVERALRLCANILVDHPQHLAPQILGRLLEHDSPLIQELMRSAELNGGRGKPWLRPLKRCFTLGTDALKGSTRSPHVDTVKGFVFTPDGTKVVSWDIDSLFAWDSNQLKYIGHSQAPGYGCTIQAIAPLQNSTEIAFALNDSNNTIFVWNIETNEVLELIHGREQIISLAVVGHLLITVGVRGAPQVWDIERRRHLFDLLCEQDGPVVTKVIAAPDGTDLIGVGKGYVCRWSVPTRDLQFARHVSNLYVDQMCLTSDGRWLLTIGGINHSWDRTVRYIDAFTGAPGMVLQSNNDEDEDEDMVGVVSIAVESGSGWIYTASRDRTVKTWDSTTGQLIKTVKHAHVWALAVNSDGCLVANPQGEIQLWDKRSFDVPHDSDMGLPITDVACNKTGDCVVAASGEAPPWIWMHGRRATPPTEPVCRVAVTNDARILITASDVGAVKLWSIGDARLLGELEHDGPTVQILKVSPDDKVVVARIDGRVSVWDIAGEMPPRQIASNVVPQSQMLAVSIHANVAACDGKSVWDDVGFYSIGTGKLIRHVHHSPPDRVVGAAAISIDGNRVAVASGSWRTRGGSEVIVEYLDGGRATRVSLENETDSVASLAFSPEEKELVICDVNGSLMIWNIGSQAIITHFCPTPFSVCTFSGDGQTVVAGDRNGYVHILKREGG